MTTEPGDEKAAGGPGRGHFRASHADREQVIAALRAAFIQGRLTRDEFDLRVGRALGARTYAELAALTADLPAGLTGPVARNAPQPGIRPRRRRRARRIAGSLAAIAVIAAALSVASLSHRPAAVAPPRPAGAVMYVVASNGVIPVTTATNTAGRPIKIDGGILSAIAITPDAKTAYVMMQYGESRRPRHYGAVIPVATATNARGKPIKIGGFPASIAITPDGRTAYVAAFPTSPPASTAAQYGHAGRDRHQHAGKPIKISGIPAAIAITPDGQTAYVVSYSQSATTVTPITTATNTPGKPIKIGGGASALRRSRSRSRRTARLPTSSAPPRGEQRSPRSRPPPTCRAGRSASAVSAVSSTVTAIAITPDGKTAYVADGNHRTVIPVATATNAPGRPIKINGTPVAIAVTPDGKTAYVATAAYITRSCPGCPVGTVIPVATGTNTPGKPINIGRVPKAIAITR